MNLTILRVVVKNGLYLFAALFFCFRAAAQTNLSYVDPTIGGVGLILEPTRPTMQIPNSMVRVFPYRKDQLDDQIGYFPLTIASHRQSNLFAIMPYSGAISNALWDTGFTYDKEKITPYSYYSTLEDSRTQILFSPAARSGYFKFIYSNSPSPHIRLSVINDGQINIVGKRVVTGIENFKGMKAFFYAELNADITSIQYKNGTDKKGLLVGFSKKDTVISFKYGISFISIDQAKANLDKEIPLWDIEEVSNKASMAWQKVLSQINVTGGTTAQKKVFYTALYRCYERMVDINEYGQYYSAYDHQVHRSDSAFYADNWIWDTYIALEPLQTILNPEMETNKIKSYITMYEQSSWIPSFGLIYGDAAFMTGNHAAAWIADAWFKGLHGFDLNKAYAGLKKNSLQATLLPWRNGAATELDSFYNANGYMPALKPKEAETFTAVDKFERRQAVSVTLENSYDDWCVAQLAAAAGKRDDEQLFLKRAENYKNVFRTDKGFMWPRDNKGKWIEPFNPKLAGGQGGRDYFTENNAYTYNWDVKHDLKNLFTLMGGRDKAQAKLDDLFRADIGANKYTLWYSFPDATGLVGQFVMGNEPSFHIPYLYNYLGAPWKTQKRIRMLLDTWYTDNLFGMPGDEDGGGMSAFVVFSMMGFFPVTPGIPNYNIGSPVFNTINIKLSNGKTFSINAHNNSNDNKYIQQAKLNGTVLNKPWFTHQDLINGGQLDFIMSDTPNKTWGSNEADSPPSSILFKP
ncbi:MAG: GH92 family glycosyl hydrolase [Mucilaginibacter sp.]|uniref:GH92 family glycosyl hydrolase n=1 Tax=Mucilaginibacter sp. TaxID=1882438 RepID=UPI00326452DB